MNEKCVSGKKKRTTKQRGYGERIDLEKNVHVKEYNQDIFHLILKGSVLFSMTKENIVDYFLSVILVYFYELR